MRTVFTARSFRALAIGVTAGLVGSLVLAGTATAVPRAEIPTDPAQWAATPYSPLPWSEVGAVDNNAYLTFDGGAAGLPDSADVGTGFTAVQPSSNEVAATTTTPGTLPGYFVPGNLTVQGGQLKVKATQGIAFNAPTGTPGVTAPSANTNSQDNALGVGVDSAGGKKILLRTVLAGFPTAAQGSAQAGIWFGPDEANYVKLAVIGDTATTRQIQLYKEVNNNTTSPTGTASPRSSADQVIVSGVSTASLATAPITLQLPRHHQRSARQRLRREPPHRGRRQWRLRPRGSLHHQPQHDARPGRPAHVHLRGVRSR
jgi:hypothetical protein